MTMQHPNFYAIPVSKAVIAAIVGSCCMLEAQKKNSWDETESPFNQFRSIVWKDCKDLGVFQNEDKLKVMVMNQFELFKTFNDWHPGMNQLQKFKKLSFELETLDSKKWIQMLKI